MECDIQFHLLNKLLAVEKDFAEHGYKSEAHQIRLVAEMFNDSYLIVLPQE